MLSNRVIPVLLLKNNGLVKTCRFKNPKYVGDPINAIKIFNKKEVDELVVLDIEASKKNHEPNYKLIEKIAGECFMPLAYGGGIKSLMQAKKIFSLGVEKICLQSSVIYDTSLIKEISEVYGSQSIIISVDVKRDVFGRPRIYNSSVNKKLKIKLFKKLVEFEKAGAGEILLHAIHREGTFLGPDLELISQTSKYIKIPLIALGGISKMTEIKEAVDAGADAVAAGSFFVFYGPHKAVLISYPKYEDLENLLYSKEGKI